MKHKKIGLLGGLTPESTVLYYRYITSEYTKRYGDYGFPEILIHSVTFQDFMDWARGGNWDAAADKMVEIFDGLKGAGADFGLMTANTPHLVFDEVAGRTSLPLLSIVEVTVEKVRNSGLRAVGLLGTETTMNSPMYPETLGAHGIETVLPDPEDRAELSRIIYEELSGAVLKPESKNEYLRVIGELEERGAQGIILGCTEIPMLIEKKDVPIPLFDTTRIHAEAALGRSVQF
jgi:aspartate racemase